LNWKLSVTITVLITFMSANVFWLLSAVYVFKVVELGEPEVLTGFEAVRKLIEIYGIKAYLNGAYGYFIFTLISLATGNFLIKSKTIFNIIAGSIGIGLIGAIIYYLFSITVHIQDRASESDTTLSGLDALSEIGFNNIVIGITGVWIILSITILLDLGIKSIVFKIRGRIQGRRLG